MNSENKPVSPLPEIASEPTEIAWCSSCDAMHQVQRPKCPSCGDWLLFAGEEDDEL